MKIMDKIILNDLKINAIIGIYAWERKILQTLTFDFEMDWDISMAATRDHINDTLHYGDMVNIIVEFVEKSRYQIIETLAEDLCGLLLEEFPIPEIQLTLSKPVALHGQNIAKIIIKRIQIDE